jgi:hypothetical protein
MSEQNVYALRHSAIRRILEDGAPLWLRVREGDIESAYAMVQNGNIVYGFLEEQADNPKHVEAKQGRFVEVLRSDESLPEVIRVAAGNDFDLKEKLYTHLFEDKGDRTITGLYNEHGLRLLQVKAEPDLGVLATNIERNRGKYKDALRFLNSHDQEGVAESEAFIRNILREGIEDVALSVLEGKFGQESTKNADVLRSLRNALTVYRDAIFNTADFTYSDGRLMGLERINDAWDFTLCQAV